MPKVFIVRPFGKKTFFKKEKGDESIMALQFDFDKVEKELIKPAMKSLKLSGGTTGEIFEAGDIRQDMFSELLLADLVIADISIYNANVFYELGIRHALRDKRTILIKSPGLDDTPFDIVGYKYITYDNDNLALALPNLIRAIEETMAADRKDSPVFNMLPMLEIQDTEKYLALPMDFVDELEAAISSKDFGKIWLLRTEIEGFPWSIRALRLIGKTLFWDFELYAYAADVMESIRADKPNDIEANDWLSTIYQRLAGKAKTEEQRDALLDKSDTAVSRLIAQRSKLDQAKLAEVYALKARNLKTRWGYKWRKKSTLAEKQIDAFSSDLIHDSIENYQDAFASDLNHYYSGINALCLSVLIIELAEKQKDAWDAVFDGDASKKLKQYQDSCKELFIIVNQSIETEIKRVQLLVKTESDKEKLKKLSERLIWAKISRADINFLQKKESAPASGVITKYTNSVDGNKQQFNMSSALAQLRLFTELGVKPVLADSVIKAFDSKGPDNEKPRHVILFTGHMIDKPDRASPRFPPSKEAAVRQLIKEKIAEEKNILEEKFSLSGIAGGACGGDILFHEICSELKIPTQIHLALPCEKFVVESVDFADSDWRRRFDVLYDKLPYLVLEEQKELPKWLQKKADYYNIWMRNNLWELNSALINGGKRMTLIALWDGKGGDGPGGTEHMVKEAQDKGARVIVIDIGTI